MRECYNRSHVVGDGGGEGGISIILKTLYNTGQPIWRYVLKAWVIAVVPSMLIAIIIGLIGGPDVQEGIVRGQSPQLFVVGALLLSPWIETLLMWPILALYTRVLPLMHLVVLASALTWAAFHSLLVPLWGLAVFWPFYVFSVAFLEWSRKSILLAIFVTALIHTCQNLIPSILLLTSA